MTKLALHNDDHPAAALKHLEDARALLAAGRHDGAGYLAGYAVECGFKSVAIYAHVAQHGAGSLQTAHAQARQPKHNLTALLALLVGPRAARYCPTVKSTHGVFSWRETLRYRPPHTIDEATAKDWHSIATSVCEETVVKMHLDGVL